MRNPTSHIAALLGFITVASCSAAPQNGALETPYAFIAKITTTDGDREAVTNLISTALIGSDCISCQLIADKADPNLIWITETWPNQAAHRAALASAKVQTALSRGKPMIMKMERMADSAE